MADEQTTEQVTTTTPEEVQQPQEMPLEQIFDRSQGENIWSNPEQSPEPSATAAPEPAPAAEPLEKPAELPGAGPIQEPAPQPGLTADAIAEAFAKVLQSQQQPRQHVPQQEVPDWYSDPEAAAAHFQREAEKRRVADRIDQSFAIAARQIDDYAEVFGEGEKNLAAYLKNNPHMQEYISSNPAPAYAAYDLLKREQMLSKVSAAGGLDALVEAELQRRLEAQAATQPAAHPSSAPAQQPAQPALQVVPQQPAPAIPAMMGNERSAPPRGAPKYEGEMPLEELDKLRPGHRRQA